MPAASLSASVVVAVRNSEKTLEKCVRSMLALDFAGERELIFVDNGSSDRSLEILRSFGSAIRVLHEPKRGAAAARNRGIRAARFEAVAFTDSDCQADPGWLRELVAPLADEGVGASGGAILARRPCNAIEAFGENVHDNGKAITHYQPPYVASGNWASRGRVLESVGGFDENFLRAQDVELSCRLLQAGYRFAYAERAIVYHHNESTYGGLFREGFQHGLHNVGLIERHRAFYEGFGYRPRRWGPYRQLWGYLQEYVAPRSAGAGRAEAACHLVFNAGKRAGRLAGSFRHRRLHI